MVTKQQVAKLKKLRSEGFSVEECALRAGMSRKTAGKYLRGGDMGRFRERTHRTHPDAFEHVWSEIEVLLKGDTPFEATTILEWLRERYPGRFDNSRLRTLQRRIKRWRALCGPGKETFFTQIHRPGDLCGSDFTGASRLRVTIGGSPYEHMFYHFVLTYSNWEWIEPCPSESFESLSSGLQEALWRLGGVPVRHRSDRFSAAVTNLKDRAEFTERYRALLSHYGLKPEKIQAKKPHENGDVEQSHRRFLGALDQALELRGSRDFASREEYRHFLHRFCEKRNAGRCQRFSDEAPLLRPLPERRLGDFKRLNLRVRKTSTIAVGGNIYSVHSRLIGELLKAHLYAERIELFLGDQLVERLPRLRGRDKHLIQYRHIIDWLVRKPGAFANYVYRDELYPTTHFRVAYDRLRSENPNAATKSYLKLLKLAADESESLVDEALRILLGDEQPLEYARVKRFVDALSAVPSPADVFIQDVDLTEYDALFLGGTARE